MLYVAFLRAINTGNRRIKMVDLRSLYGDLGFSDVATYIATGNVIFDAPSPPPLALLEQPFEDRFGFASEVFLRTAAQVESLIGRNPWTDADAVVVEVSFLEHEPEGAPSRTLEATAVAPEQLLVDGTEVLFLRGLGRGVPTIHKEATSLKVLGMKMTRRSMATVHRIHDRYLIPEA